MESFSAERRGEALAKIDARHRARRRADEAALDLQPAAGDARGGSWIWTTSSRA